MSKIPIKLQPDSYETYTFIENHNYDISKNLLSENTHELKLIITLINVILKISPNVDKKLYL